MPKEKESIQKMPPEAFEGQCQARKKVCSQCKFRYKKGDKAWACPHCGDSRRCKNKSHKDFNVCRRHGAGGGRPPNSTYIIAEAISAAFNRILNDDKIWEMAEQQAVLGTHFEELVLQLDGIDKEGGVDVMALASLLGRMSPLVGIEKAEGKLLNMIQDALDMLREEYRAQILWNQIYSSIEMMRKNADSHKRWIKDKDTLVTISEVIEIIQFFQQMAFKFIPDSHDRKAYAQQVRAYVMEDAKVIEGEYVEVIQEKKKKAQKKLSDGK